MLLLARVSIWSALLVVAVVLEARFGHRVARDDTNPGARAADTIMIVATGFCLSETFVAQFFGGLGSNYAWIAVGAVMAIAGIRLRTWAMRTLGSRFALTPVAMPTDRRLVVDGPYAHLRHPGYLGLYLYLGGLGAVLAPVMAFVTLVLLVLLGSLRIRGEENLLRSEFGARYDSYCESVRWRVLPWIY